MRLSIQDPVTVGRRVRDLRLRRGLSQRGLAEPRYDGSFVSQIEAGRRTPSSDALAYFAGRLGVAVDELTALVPPSMRLELEMLLKEAIDLKEAGDLKAAAPVFARLEEAATSSGATDFRAEAIIELGYISELAGELSSAIDRYHEVEALPVSDELRTRAWIMLGRAYRTAGDYAYSIDVTERALAFARERGWALHAVRAVVQLASTLSDRGDFSRARKILDSARADSALLRDARALAALHWARARNSADLGNAEEALRHIETARVLAAHEQSTVDLARLEGARAYHLMELGRPHEAAPIFEASVRTLVETGAVLEAARLQTEHARAELATGNRDRARVLAEEALERLRGFEDPVEEAQCSLVLALALGAQPRAETLIRWACDRFAEHGAAEQHARALQALGEYLVLTGRPDEALTTFRDALSKVVTPVVS